MRILTIIKSLVILGGVSLLVVTPSFAQTTPAPSAPASGQKCNPAEKLQKLQAHEQKLEAKINSGELTGEKLAKAQAHLSKLQAHIAKLQAKTGQT